MPNWKHLARAAAGLALGLTLLGNPALAGNRFSLHFSAPAGMQFTTETPRHALALRTGKVRLHPKFMRQVVPFRTNQAAGTIIVNTGEKFLYLVLGQGRALRYGIGTARDGFEWSGTHRITNKREWPGWTPPAAMRERQPGLPAHMPGGIDNPLGARALYIGSTLYRIHGTNAPWTIGHDVSSGCIRLTNEDIVDLYGRVKIGARVIVL